MDGSDKPASAPSSGTGDDAILSPEQIEAYGRAAGVLPDGVPAEVVELSGGVSSSVLRAEAGGQCVVFKQALPKLKVRDEWTSPVGRALTEAKAAEALARLLPEGAILPPVLMDAERHLYAMPCAPPGANTWKSFLLAGHLVDHTARRAGKLLGLLHRRSRADPALAESFADRQYFLALRVDPYLRTTAQRRPELASAIARNQERMLATRRCLVHGDYSPKNLLVSPSDPARVILLDHEVAHWGDPAFDLGFCLTHLHLKACAFPARAAGYLRLARLFWLEYLAAARPEHPDALEVETVGLLGCIVAARVDGKSPVEYLRTEEERDLVRELARTILLGGVSTLQEAGEALTTALRERSGGE